MNKGRLEAFSDGVLAILQFTIIKIQVAVSVLAKAVGKDLKGKISPILYAFGITCRWINTWISGALFVLVAFIWLIPDKRIENIVK